MPSEAEFNNALRPPLIAVASWILPGAGYYLLGQKARGLTVGVTILVLFILGILIGGIRVIEVPLYDDHGRYLAGKGLIDEIRAKPWAVPQVLTGPVSVAAGAWSVWAAQPDTPDSSKPRAPLSHVRVNEIGSLYLSVAGLLNLMAILDASYRAANDHRHEESEAGAAA